MNQKVQDAIQTILNEVGAISRQHQQEIVDTIHQTVSQEHRTLQQAFWSKMLLAQIKYAGNSSDLRNEAAVKLAKAVKETATGLNFDYGLPFI
jgi:UDP-N-acetyl-D-mannosaminuronate dehydrogenase